MAELIEEGEVFASMMVCAKILNVHVRTIKRAIQAGKLKAYKVGRNKIRVRRVDFQNYLNNLGYSHNMPEMRGKIKSAIDYVEKLPTK